MASWYASKRRITVALERPMSVHRNESYTPSELFFDNSLPLVLTHADTALRDVRSDNNGRVWLIDWEFADAYPQWFEYTGIMVCEGWSDTPQTWLWLAPIMAGWYRSQYLFFKS